MIKAYLKRKQTDELRETGDARLDALNARRIQAEAAHLKMKEQRRLDWKNAKIVKNGGTPPEPSGGNVSPIKSPTVSPGLSRRSALLG